MAAAVVIAMAMGCVWPRSADAVQVPPISSQGGDALEGSVTAMASSIRQTPDGQTEPPSISLLLRIDGELISVSLADDAVVTDADGRVITPNDIPLAARVRVEGRQVSDTQFEATLVEVLP